MRFSYSVYSDSRWNDDKCAYAAYAFTFHPPGNWVGQKTWVNEIYSPDNNIEILNLTAEFRAIHHALDHAVTQCQRHRSFASEVVVWTATKYAQSCMHEVVERRARNVSPDLTLFMPHYHQELKKIAQCADQIRDCGARVMFFHSEWGNLLAQNSVRRRMEELEEAEVTL